LPARAPLSVALAFALAFASGCMTIDTLNDEGYDGPRTYSGVRKDMAIFPDAFLSLSFPWMGITLVDFPFSLIADTVILPVTIPREAERQKGLADEARVDTERPGVLKAEPGESEVDTAHRLFTECAKLLHAQDPHFADCYSVDARVEITGSEPVSGADYKPALRKDLARDASEGALVDWREPSFASEGDRVRIAAKWASSLTPTRLPVVLIVGPCPDGAWRIVEEISPGLTRQ
jgi:uncharacterized protein YceK